MANEVTSKVNEAQKYGVIEETLSGRMTVKTAAEILGLSERQIFRLRNRVKQQGAQGIVHGNRGCPPSHSKPAAVRQEVVERYRKEYEGYNFTHFAETLEKEHRIRVSDETVWRHAAVRMERFVFTIRNWGEFHIGNSQD